MDDEKSHEKLPEDVGEAEANSQQCRATLHQDVVHDAAADSRIRRKLDRHMMPLFFALCKDTIDTPSSMSALFLPFNKSN